MSEPFAEATIVLRPDLTKFVTDLRRDVKAAIDKVEGTTDAQIRIAPALTRDFIGDLRKQVNLAVAQAATKLKPIPIQGVITGIQQPTGPLRAPRAQTPRAPRAAAAAAAETVAVKQLTGQLALFESAETAATEAQLGMALAADKVTAATQVSTVAKEKETQTTQAATKAKVLESKALSTLASAEEKVTTARLADPGSLARRRAITGAEAAFPKARAQATASELASVNALVDELSASIQTLQLEDRELAASTSQVNQALSGQQRILAKSTATVIAQTASERELALIERQVAAARLGITGSEAQLIQLRTAATRATIAAVIAEEELARASSPAAALAANQTRAAALALARQLQVELDAEAAARLKARDAANAQRAAIAASNKELRSQQADVSRAARSQAQLRRGAVATSLSFLGIRGATLAASASFLAGAASIAVFAKALQNAAQFSEQLSVFRATTGATAAELERVRESARALGADISLPGVTAADAAESMTELAKAGLNVQESIAGARGVLQLATAAAIDNAQAVELAANAINAFELSGRDATLVADTFANAANAAQGSIVDIGIAFQQASAAGRQVGLSFQDTTTFLTVLARSGLRGSDAGTSLRTALLRLIRPTAAAAEKMKDLGIETRDAAGNLRPDIFVQITEATKELTPAARDATIALIGGQDAFRAISILGRQSIQDFIKLRRELREQGTAGELAAARMEGLRGSIEALGNTLNTVGIRIGQSVTPALQGLVGGLTTGAAAMAESEQVAEIFAGVLDTVQLSASALGATLGLLAPPLSLVAGAFGQVAGSLGVPTIIAAIAAYKLLPAVFARVATSAAAMRLAVLASAASMSLATFPLASLRAAAGALLPQLDLIKIAAVVAAAAIVFLATRETTAERNTRKLKEATDDLADSIANLRSIRQEGAATGLGLNAARLSILEARTAVGTARAALESSKAARGSFERRKLELQLAVAIDDVAAAQGRYTTAIQDYVTFQEQARQAERERNDAQQDTIQTIRDIVGAQRDLETRRDLPQLDQEERHRIAIERTTASLRSRAEEERALNTRESIGIGKRLDLLADLSNELDRLPSDQAIRIAFTAPNLKTALDRMLTEFGVTSDAMRKKMIDAVTGPSAIQEFGNRVVGGLRRTAAAFREAGIQLGKETGGGIDEGLKSTQAQLQATLVGMITRARAQLSGLEREALDITIRGGGPAEQLANLRAQEAEAARVLAAQRRRLGQPGGVSNEAVRAAQEDLAAIIEERRALEDQMAADVKSAAEESKRKAEEARDKAQEDRDKADEALLESLGFGREAAQERILDAQATEGLRDDIRRTAELRGLVLKQIETIRDRIKNAEVRRDAIRELGRISRDLARDQRELQRQRQENLRDQAAERNQLDIEFAQTNENRRAEIRARQREIRRLERLQALTKAGTNAYKRYRNLIAEQRKAIEDLKNEEKERRNDTQRMIFEFMQREVGFVENLIGNLIPGGLQTSLVGMGETRPGRTLGQPPGGAPLIQKGKLPAGFEGLGGAAGATLAKAQQRLATGDGATKVQGVSAGQGNVQIDLLRKILTQVRRANGASEHPEGKQQRRTGATAGDYSGGSPVVGL